MEKKGRFFELIDEKATSFTRDEGQIRVPVYSETLKYHKGSKYSTFLLSTQRLKHYPFQED